MITWGEYEARESAPPEGIDGFQPVLLKTSYDPLAPYGGEKAVWPSRDARRYFALISVIGMYFPQYQKHGPKPVLWVKRYREPGSYEVNGNKVQKLLYDRCVIEDIGLINDIRKSADGLRTCDPGKPATDYYIVHNDARHLQVIHHTRYQLACNDLWDMPWTRGTTNALVGSWFSNPVKLWDGDS